MLHWRGAVQRTQLAMPHPTRLILLLLLLMVSLLRAETLRGVCTHVVDGDTLIIQQPGKGNQTIRLYGIDAPETKQPFGESARAHLQDLVLGQPLRAEVRGKDRYGRSIARVYVNSSDINLSLVQEGYAWHYAAYAPNDFDLAEAEALAAANHLGLWQQEKPIAPWEYRKGERPAAPNPHHHPYWVTETGTIHNSHCKYFGVTQKGQYISTPAADAPNCKLCGGATVVEPDFPAWWNILLLALLFFLLPLVLIRLLIVRARKRS